MQRTTDNKYRISGYSVIMLKELLRYDNIGNRREIGFVLFQAITPNGQHTISELRRFCVSNIFSIGRSIDGIFELLRFLSIVKIENQILWLDRSIFDPSAYPSADNYFQCSHFYNLLFKNLSAAKKDKDFLNENNRKFNSRLNQFYIQSHLIPFELFTIRNLLLRLAFLEPDQNITDHLFVSPAFTKFFKETIADALIHETGNYKVNLEQLKKGLQRKDEIGRQGELAVVLFEQYRLQGHSRSAQIRRISEEYVNAGYDIKSFDNLDSFINDRFIEVKTYANEIAFYWSRHEVEVARKLSGKYWLYLIDAGRMNTKGYSPKMIQDPYAKIFENEQWKKEIEKWKISFEDSNDDLGGKILTPDLLTSLE